MQITHGNIFSILDELISAAETNQKYIMYKPSERAKMQFWMNSVSHFIFIQAVKLGAFTVALYMGDSAKITKYKSFTVRVCDRVDANAILFVNVGLDTTEDQVIAQHRRLSDAPRTEIAPTVWLGMDLTKST